MKIQVKNFCIQKISKNLEMSYQDKRSEVQDVAVGYPAKINEVAQNFLENLKEEKARLSDDFPLCGILIDEAFDRVYSTGRVPGREFYADVLKQKPIKLTQKVYVPVKKYPKFNFTGKILGPKGNSLIRLQQETQCKITIKGRNSMRDHNKEEELRNSGDPRFNNLHKDLFVEISALATPAECYARIAYALAEVRKYLIPDKNDEVSQEQLREIMEIDPEMAKRSYGAYPEVYKTVFEKPKRTQRYMSILKHTYAEREELEDDNEYKNVSHVRPHPFPKRSSSTNGYEYVKVPSSSKGNYHSAEAIYTKPKRIYETYSSKPHNSEMYGILKKIKLSEKDN